MQKEIIVTIEGEPASRIVGGEKLSGVAAFLVGEPEVYVVYDENVSWVASEVIGAVSGGVKGSIAIDASEEDKSMDTVLQICRTLMDAGASRKAMVVAVGGGITTDLVGFAASIYKRGVRYANVPTTLLAQVDAAVGGKTGVNFDAYKNMLGVIVQPAFTFICAETLRTLPPRDFRSGAAELLKTFLIDNKEDNYSRAVKWLSEGGSPEELQELVFAAAGVKAGIVSRDPFEADERRKLNLGHTFAHAIEHEARLRGDDITHGEAVAMGTILAARLSERIGRADSGFAESLKADFEACGLPVSCPYPVESLTDAMGRDKKAAGDTVAFVLPERIGVVGIHNLSLDQTKMI